MVVKSLLRPVPLPSRQTVRLLCGWERQCFLPRSFQKKEAGEGVDFLPMSVDYQEKFAASGKIPGGFFEERGQAIRL